MITRMFASNSEYYQSLHKEKLIEHYKRTCKILKGYRQKNNNSEYYQEIKANKKTDFENQKDYEMQRKLILKLIQDFDKKEDLAYIKRRYKHGY